MKKLALKDAPQVLARTVEAIVNKGLDVMAEEDLQAERERNAPALVAKQQRKKAQEKALAEAAYTPPEQADAFRPAMPIDAAGRKLLQELEKIERLEEEKQGIMADQAEILAELKAEGYDMAAVRDLIRLRKLDDYSERLLMVKLYVERVGMVWPA